MSCPCAAVTGEPGGCCSIHGTVPAGTGVRLVFHGSGVGSTPQKLTAYIADSTGTVTPSSSQRFYVLFAQVVVETAGEIHLFRGNSTADGANAYNTILRGNVSNNGGIVANLPGISLAPGQEIYCLFPGSGDVDAVVYGVLV